MPKQVPHKRISQTDARNFLAKADEFLAAATECFGLALHSAATSNAVHAGISACDAITGFRRGYRASGQDHYQVLELLKGMPEEKEVAGYITALLKAKPKAQYDPTPITKAVAISATRRATHLVEIAHKLATSKR